MRHFGRLSVGVTLGLLFAANAVLAAPLCRDVVQTEPLGVSRTWAPPIFDKAKSTLIQLPELTPILNQGALGFCWLFSAKTNLMNRYVLRTGDHDADVSIYYWSYFHWLKHGLDAVSNPQAGAADEGGWMDWAINIIREHGAISNEDWSAMGGATDIQLAYPSLLEHVQIKTVLSHVHRHTELLQKWLRPGFKFNDDEKSVALYYKTLSANRDFQIALTDFFIEKTKKPGSLPAAQVAELKKIWASRQIPNQVLNQKEITDVFDMITRDGKADMVRAFNQIYFKSDLSPLETQLDRRAAQQKAAMMFPEINEHVVNLFIANKNELGKLSRSPNEPAYSISADQAALVAKALLQSRTPVLLDYDHNDYFVASNDSRQPEYNGTMSVRRMKSTPASPYLTRRQRDADGSHYDTGAHAVNLIGAWLNPKTSDVLAFREQNNWGDQLGDHGYYEMDRDYFGAFAIGLSMFTSDLEKPEVAKALGPELVAKLRHDFAHLRSKQI